MFENEEMKKRKREAAYWKGVDKARQTGFVEGLMESIADLVVPPSMGTDEYQSYKQGYADFASGKIKGAPAEQAKDEKPLRLDASVKAWYALCDASEFLPEETVEHFRDALIAAGQQVPFVIGLTRFTEQPCPRCGERGYFKIRFLGRVAHATCDWNGFMGTGAYVGHQVAQVFHTGIRAGGAVKDEADKKPDKRGNWIYAVFGFLFVAAFRAAAAVVLIPLHCFFALLSPGRAASDRVTSGVVLASALGVCVFGIYELQQAANMPVPVRAPISNASLPTQRTAVPLPVSLPQQTHDLQVANYTFRATGDGLGEGSLEIFSGGRSILSRKGMSFSTNSYTFSGAPPGWSNGMDVVGQGVPNVLVEEVSGGNRCCTIWHLFSLRDPIAEIPIPSDTTRGFPLRDVNGDGIFELFVDDNTFSGWNTSYAESPMITLTYAFRDGHFTFAPDLMRHQPFTPDELRTLVDEVRWPVDSATPLPFPAKLWSGALTLIASGNVAQVDEYMALAWPASRPGKESFVASFYTQLATSPHWGDLNSLNHEALRR